MRGLHRFVILIVVCVVGVSGCALTDSFKSPEKIANEYADIIMDCFKTGKTEKLESVFCDRIKNTHDIKAEITQALEFIDGNIVDEGRKFAMDESEAYWDCGIKTFSSISPSIDKIITDTGKKYDIAYHAYVVNSGKNDTIGLTCIRIIECSDTNNKSQLDIGDLLY